jgi:deoxyribose-phosphate aldolase
MTYIEYALYDTDINEIELKQNVELAIINGANCISVPFAYTKQCRALAKDTPVIISNPIDYPLGLLDTPTRNTAILNSINNGAQKIEIVIQNNYLNFRKYEKIRQDIKSNLEICKANNVALYYYLEYRIFTHQALVKACGILQEFGLNMIYPSTGYMLDNIDDNIIATVLLHQKTGITAIFSGNLWNDRHVQSLKKNNIDSIRTNSINTLKLLGKEHHK